MSNQSDKPRLDFAGDLEFEQILTNPILDIAARVWEQDRYVAFRICYRSMRRIDDLIDDRKEGGRALTSQEVVHYSETLYYWLDALERGKSVDEFQEELLATMSQFRLPTWPWRRLCEAMVYDLTHDGFSTVLAFRRYGKGAAIAPASIFMHLCGLRRDGRRNLDPVFDVHEASRDLAMFSYFVHIIRDFEKDVRRRLFYFADDVIAEQGLTRDDLYSAVRSGHYGPEICQLVRRYRSIADYYRRRARYRLDKLQPDLGAHYRLSLELIYELYLQVFERINVSDGSFDPSAIQPRPEDVKSRLLLTIDRHTAMDR